MASSFIDMMYWKKVDTGRIDRACMVRKNISNIEVACTPLGEKRIDIKVI